MSWELSVLSCSPHHHTHAKEQSRVGGGSSKPKKTHTILGKKKKKSPPISHLQTWDLPSEQKRMPYQDWTVRSPSPAACTWTPTWAALPSLHNALINIKSLQWKAAFIGCWKYFSFSNWQAHFSSALRSCCFQVGQTHKNLTQPNCHRGLRGP